MLANYDYGRPLKIPNISELFKQMPFFYKSLNTYNFIIQIENIGSEYLSEIKKNLKKMKLQ